jgi:hypothetical protein
MRGGTTDPAPSATIGADEVGEDGGVPGRLGVATAATGTGRGWSAGCSLPGGAGSATPHV